MDKKDNVKELAEELDRGDINRFIYRTTGLMMSAMKSMLRPNIEMRGMKYLRPENPTLYVVNHFTRAETFLIPFAFYQSMKQKVRSLASHILFVGKFGDFLRITGVVSTAEPRRNRIIIGDLISGRYNWVIYPEGLLVKNKNVVDEKGNQRVMTPSRIGPPRTGSAVLAMKAELIRKRMLKAIQKKDSKRIHYYSARYGVKAEDISELPIIIQPVNITYFPIRPGRNLFNRFAEKLIKNLPSEIKEELEIEGNLVFGSDIGITICPPIDLNAYMKPVRTLLSLAPIQDDKKIDVMLGYYRFKLTRLFMGVIYRSVRVNFDHLFSAYIHERLKEDINREHLNYYFIQAALCFWFTYPQFSIHSSLRERIFLILHEGGYPHLDSVFQFAKQVGAIQEENDQLKINHVFLNQTIDFHEVRVKNTFRVIHNELKPLSKKYNLLKQLANMPIEKITVGLDKKIFDYDKKIYEADYLKYYDRSFSKAKKIGVPFYLSKGKKKIGIVLSHGFKSSPTEVIELAEYLNKQGYPVYGIRLKGHGTAPHNIKDIEWEDWLASYTLGTTAMLSRVDKVVFAGFSTGGTLSLLSAARQKKAAGVIAINAALKLVDMRTKVVSSVNRWNELLDSFKLKKGKMDFVDDADPSETPSMNYSRAYVHGVAELSQLMEVTRKDLKKVSVPTLILQADGDPVVNPQSAKIIQEGINSPNCQVKYLSVNTHHILRSEAQQKVFENIASFLEKLA